MELAHSLLLNEEALGRVSDGKKPVFIFEWLRFLDKVLVAAHKSDIKESQKKLTDQLLQQILNNPGPPTRKLLARCLATIFSVGDTFALFETINKCNDIVKNKDDSPSYLATKLTAITCIGGMYEKLGRMVGRSYEETISILVRALKNAESQGRADLLLTLQKVVVGLGSAGSNCYKDVYKAARGSMSDRSMNARCAAVQCVTALIRESPILYTTELDNVAFLAFRALDGGTYDVRCKIAKLLTALLCSALTRPTAPSSKAKPFTVDDALAVLANGFLKGGSGFLKSSTAGEMIKGTHVNREVRVGVTHAYVEFIHEMGGVWLEKNLLTVLDHVLQLSANQKACPTHVDAVYARKCVIFILRSSIGGTLSDKAQIAAAKAVCQVVLREMNSIDAAVDADRPSTAAAESNLRHHVLVCALHELSALVLSLSTSAAPLISEPSAGIIEPVISVLIHPVAAARLAAAWCLRCVAVALPSQMTILLERCLSRMVHLKSSSEAVAGYTAALSALLGGVRHIPLGIPHAKGKQIFVMAEELLRTASQNSRLSLQRTQAGWLLLGALMTLGPSVVRVHLPRMLLLWRNAFPRSVKELEAEKARGDAFTWAVTLEGRAGALSAMRSFLSACQDLLSDDVIRRILAPVECALIMTGQMPQIIKTHGSQLKPGAAMVRLRLYDVLALLPPQKYEGSFASLLRELVAEFTLTDNPANTTTSMLRSMCHANDSVILGSWLQETDHTAIEEQLQPNSASGSGALEHDPSYLFSEAPPGQTCPGPLPLGVAVIDSSVRLYGIVFPRVPHKHRLQMLEHFLECIKQAKSGRQQAVQINVFTAELCALRCLVETKTGFGQVEIRRAAFNLVMGALSSSDPILRCAAGEALGRMAQVVGESRFIAEMAQHSFDRLKSARDAVSRTGHSFALGCLHRYVGGMGSGQHLSTSVSILLALARDGASPIVQVWALHGLSLIADSGGPMFRSFVEPTLSLVLELLLTAPTAHVDLHQCLGKCLAALITTIGPELQGNTSVVAAARMSCLVCCAVMTDHHDALVQSEAIACLQQLHMFAPRHVNLSTLVPHLCNMLKSPHLLLRKAALACLRQLTQREASEVAEHAQDIGVAKDGSDKKQKGLEGALFRLLDTETEPRLVRDAQDTLVSLLQALATGKLSHWLQLIKTILQASTATDTAVAQPPEDGADDDDDDAAEMTAKNKKVEDGDSREVAPRWPTRVFALECLLKIMACCSQDPLHYDLVHARRLRSDGKGDHLVLHLAELVRMSFIAATSDSDQLRLAGLAALAEVISKFAHVPEPEFPGHVILEQYQAQVGAALRPAFSPETAPDVTAAACEVCSSWIGSGVARDLNDLRRVHQLLVSSLAKLKEGREQTPLYSEAAGTMERLAVLKAWAEVYIMAVRQRKENNAASTDESGEGESLLSLVQPEMTSLSRHWLAALKDHAMISLPSEFLSQLPAEGGAFYTTDTMDTSKVYYRASWASLLCACSLWLEEAGFTRVDRDDTRPANMQGDDTDIDRLHLLLGVAVEALCSARSEQSDEHVRLCLMALRSLICQTWPRSTLGGDRQLCIELLNVLHRQLLTREASDVLLLVSVVMKEIVLATKESIENERAKAKEEDGGNETKCIGEGEESGDLPPGKSVTFAAIETCLQSLSRHFPGVNSENISVTLKPNLDSNYLQVVVNALATVAELPFLCSPAGVVSIFPTLFHLSLSTLKEASLLPASSVVAGALQTVRALCQAAHQSDVTVRKSCVAVVQSALTAIVTPLGGADEQKLEPATLTLLLSVMLTSCPPEVFSTCALVTSCVDAYSDAWDSKNLETRLACVRSLTALFMASSKTISSPFIRSCAAPVIQHLLQTIPQRLETDPELLLVLECLRALETLVTAAADQNKVSMLSLLIPILVSFLSDDLSEISRISQRLHQTALEKLTRIGPIYPQQTRSILKSKQEWQQKLERAVLAQKKSAEEERRAAAQQTKTSTPAQPSIVLRTDFSGFKT